MIRLAAEADIPAILDIYGPYILSTAWSFEYTVPSVEAFTLRFRHHTRCCPWLVWEEAGVVLGYAYAAPAFERAAFCWDGEVSVYLAPQAQGRGIGKRLYGALEKLMFGLGYRVLYALVVEENEPSVAFHLALGYKKAMGLSRCGWKFDRWWSLLWLEKRAEIVENPTNPPVLWSEFVDSDENLKNILDILSLS